MEGGIGSCLADKLAKKLIENLGTGRPSDGGGLYLEVVPSDAGLSTCAAFHVKSDPRDMTVVRAEFSLSCGTICAVGGRTHQD
jgi:hypothetical protein